MITLKCIVCGKEFKTFPSQIKYGKKFCSNSCRYEHNKKTNEIIFENDYAYILIIKDDVTYKVLFDIEDLEKIKKYKWHLHLRKSDMRFDVCANTYGKHSERKYITMTRYLMNCPSNMAIDHINKNTLDNRKANLRIVTTYENNLNKSTNTSGCIGVTWDKERQKWLAFFKGKYLGRYINFEDAVYARKQAEENYHLQNNV